LSYFSGLSQGLVLNFDQNRDGASDSKRRRFPAINSFGDVMASKSTKKKRRRFMLRRKRTLDPSIPIDYKKPDTLKRFITDRGKIIPRRISGATAAQQRDITIAVKRARYLSLLPSSVSHRPERGFSGEMAAANAGGFRDPRAPGGPGMGRPGFGDRPFRDRDREDGDGGGDDRDMRDRDDDQE
jgi:small subunit ribosomal protein S18